MAESDKNPANIPEGMPRARPSKTKNVRRARITTELAHVIEIMAYEGVPMKIAAERGGLQPKSVFKAFTKPHVKAAYNQLVSEIRENAAQEAYLRIAHMGHNAKSATVRLDANKWIAGVGGISPVQKTQNAHHHTHSFAGFSYDDALSDPDTIEGTVNDTTSEGQGDDNQ